MYICIIMEINKISKETWKVTDGKKTAIATLAWIALRVIDWKYPDALDSSTEAVILDVAMVLGTIGIGHKIKKWWEERKDNKNKLNN
jgi:hypothetical protein